MKKIINLFSVFIMFLLSIPKNWKIKNLLSMEMVFAEELQANSFDDVLSTGILNTDDRINLHVLEPLYDGVPTAAPLFTILDKIKRTKMSTSKWKGFEQRNTPDMTSARLAFAPSSAAGLPVTIFLPTGTTGEEITRFMYPGRTVKLDLAITEQTGMGVAGYTGDGYIESVDLANQKIVVKPIDPAKKFGKNSSNVAADSPIRLLGNWNDTKAGATAQPMVIPTMVSNVSQKTRNNFSIDDDAAEERLYSGDEVARLSKLCKFEHLKDLYKSMVFNGAQYVLNQSYSSSTQIGYAGGIEASILGSSPNNVEYDDINDLYNSFATFQMGLFSTNINGGSDDRTVLANRATKQWIRDQKFARQWEITRSDMYMDVFGIPGVDEVETGQGRFHIIYDNYANQFYSNPDEPFMMAMHLGNIELGDYLKTTYYSNIQPRDVSIRMDEWRTSFSNLVFLAELHGIWRKARG